jgi:hypothetical protein
LNMILIRGGKELNSHVVLILWGIDLPGGISHMEGT